MPRKFLFCLLSHAALLALAAGICQAQFAPLATGTWLEDSQTPSCSPSAGWVSGGTCKHYTVSCGGIDDIGITVNYVAPQGTSNGTIVFFSQGGGESPSTTLARRPPSRLLTWDRISALFRHPGIAIGRQVGALAPIASSRLDAGQPQCKQHKWLFHLPPLGRYVRAGC